MADEKPNGSAARLRDLFIQARELPEGPQREQFLDAAAGEDLPLKKELQSLLQANQDASGFLNNNGAGSPIGPWGGCPG